MRKIKEVLRLKYDLDLGQRQIARSCSSAACRNSLFPITPEQALRALAVTIRT